jgi:hypothetical protein
MNTHIYNQDGKINNFTKKRIAEFKKGLSIIVRRFFVFGANEERVLYWTSGVDKQVFKKEKEYSPFSVSFLDKINKKVDLSVHGAEYDGPFNNDSKILVQSYESLINSIFVQYHEDCNFQELSLVLRWAKVEQIELSFSQINEPEKNKKPSGKIPLWNESSVNLLERKSIGCALEDCVFCTKKTSTWHMNTNNPICLSCAEIFYVKDIPEDFGKTIRKNKRKGTFILDDETKAN